MISQINDIVQENKSLFKSAAQMVASYNREREICKDYNGRQLLELIQNADDAGSDYITISLDTLNKSLVVENGGAPFSLEGFRSLLIPNLSSKRKKIFIGNKGLGFRSILNWSKQVVVESKGISLSFSKENASNNFENIHNGKSMQILDEFDLASHAIPFPFFGVPEIKEISNQSNSEFTKISIDYHSHLEKDILDQLIELREEVLLFLPHIFKIQISIDGELTSFCSEKNADKSEIKINDRSWDIYSDEGKLPEKYRDENKKEDEYYSLKLAVQESLSDNYFKLFNFFPTKVDLKLPILVHGTFELDSSRNQLVDSDKNKFLLEKLVELLLNTMDEKFLSSSDWSKIRFIDYKDKNSVLDKLGLYDILDRKLASYKVFPCVDGEYRSLSDIKFHGNEISEFIIANDKAEFFPDLLLPVPQECVTFLEQVYPDFRNRKYAEEEIIFRSNSLADNLKCNVPLLSDWIFAISELSSFEKYFSMLINDSHEIIPQEKTIFTPETSTDDCKGIQAPDHVEIDFMNNELYQCLIERFGFSTEKDKARALQRKLKSVFHIQSYEPSPVLTQIISQTKIYGDETDIARVQNMLSCLFDFYQRNNENLKASQLRLDNIPLITLNKSIGFSKDMFLSKSYPTGMNRIDILGEIYSLDDQVCDMDSLGLKGDLDSVEKFLVEFLGVGRYVKIVEEKDSVNNGSYWGYLEFVFQKKGRPSDYRSSKLSFLRIENLDVITSIFKSNPDKTDLLKWILNDEIICHSCLSDSVEGFRYSKVREKGDTYYHSIHGFPSYILYQLYKEEYFKDYLIQDLGLNFLNTITLDSNFDKAKKHDVKHILHKLGAVEDFSELSIERINDIIYQLPENDGIGKYAQKIYRLAVKNYDENKQALSDVENLNLLAYKGNEVGYFAREDVYYADNILLPKKIVDQKPILKFDKRAGVGRVTEFFGIKPLNQIDLENVSKDISIEDSDVLNNFIEKIKPFILTERLQKVKAGEESISALKKMDIRVCREISCEIDGEFIEFDDYDFIGETGTNNTSGFLFKYSGAIGHKIQTDSKIADTIAEIISIVFKVNEHRDFIRFVLRNDFEDSRYFLTEKYGEEAILEAYSLLGVSEQERKFWKRIYSLKNINFSLDEMTDVPSFLSRVKTDLNLSSLPRKINYSKLDDKSNFNRFKNLFQELNLNISTFNEDGNDTKINLSSYHLPNITNVISKLQNSFERVLWIEMNSVNKARQEYFFHTIEEFKTLADKICSRKFQYSFDCNYENEIIVQVLSDFKIDLKINQEEGVMPYDKVYKENLEACGISNMQVNELPNNLKSLLYFTDLNVALIQENVGVVEEKLGEQEPFKELDQLEILDLTDYEFTGKGNSNHHKIPNRRKSKSRLHSRLDNQRKSINGRKAERRVYVSLIEKYGKENVDWVSGNSEVGTVRDDSLGYDLKYRDKMHGDKLTFVEVKAFQSNHFFFTANEFNIAKECIDDYFIFLVEEKEIKRISARDLIIGENLESNENFEIVAGEYVVYPK
ncbi:sacsin N-terminal ATP-binding-like domain-containing protein [Ancylomarina sp. YFZ004]